MFTQKNISPPTYSLAGGELGVSGVLGDRSSRRGRRRGGDPNSADEDAEAEAASSVRLDLRRIEDLCAVAEDEAAAAAVTACLLRDRRFGI